MPKKSLVDILLTEEDRSDFDRLIGEGKSSLDELVEWLNGRGYEISRSSVHRHSTKISAIAEHLRQSRAVVKALATELGEATVQGEQGRLLVEMVRSLAFEMLTGRGDEAAPLTPDDVMKLGKGFAELARAGRFDQDYETKIAERVEKETKARAAEAVKRVAQTKGITQDTLDAITKMLTGDG